MEIDSAIFQDLESFGKREVFQHGYETVCIFVWENSKIPCNGYNLVSY